MQHIVGDLHRRLGCNYAGDIQAIFVESDRQCTSFRIGATITSNSTSFSCQNPSRVETSLSHWTSSYGTVQKYSNTATHPGPRRTYCIDKSEPSNRGNLTKECHRVIYCFHTRATKDRTVCRSAKGSFKKIEKKTGQRASPLDPISSDNLRSFCGVTFT